MRIHHPDNRRKEETRRDEMRRREVRGMLRMSEVVRELGVLGQLIRTECAEFTILLHDIKFMDFKRPSERTFNF
jgi:hypothetical protein